MLLGSVIYSQQDLHMMLFGSGKELLVWKGYNWRNKSLCLHLVGGK